MNSGLGDICSLQKNVKRGMGFCMTSTKNLLKIKVTEDFIATISME